MTSLPRFLPFYDDLLDETLRQRATTLTAFMRFIEDIDSDSDAPAVARRDWLIGLDGTLARNEADTPLPPPLPEFLSDLQHHGIAPIAARHILQGAAKGLDGVRIRSWSELTTYCQFRYAPAGRVFMTLAGEVNDDVIRQTEKLSIAAAILRMVSSARKDTCENDRLFMPEDWFRAASISPDRMAYAAEGQIRAVLDRVLDGADHLLAECAPLPGLINDRHMAKAAQVSLCRMRRFSQRLRRKDPLPGSTRLNWLDLFLCRIGSK